MTRFSITTPIYYVNDVPHLGHAYTSVACDVLTRFHRLDGKHTFFLTGTDEHGQKVAKAAATAKTSPKAFVDRTHTSFLALGRLLGIDADDFIRTTEQRHVRAAQALWKAMAANGHIYQGKYAGWYAVRDEAFYDESETTVGPDGQRIAPTGAPVEWVEEPSFFFRLSEWRERLLAFYEANPRFVQPASRFNEVKALVERGLDDVSISRTSFTWGIPVPGAKGHVMYVWVDALTNYISALGYPDAKAERFAAFWPADIHMVGKDILRFHAVLWPAMLMAGGLEPPRQVFAHGWWMAEGQKMSKSLGNVIDPVEIVDRYGCDAIRYFMLREVPFGQDGNFSRMGLVRRINADLAHDLGNLAMRVLKLVQSHCDGEIPQASSFNADDIDLWFNGGELLDTVRADLDACHFHKALERIWAHIGLANRYVGAQAPWSLRETQPERMRTVMFVLLETLRRLGLILAPFMPGSMMKLRELLAIDDSHATFEAWNVQLTPGTPLPAPYALFPRIVETEIN